MTRQFASAREVTIPIADGTEIAGLQYGSDGSDGEDTHHVICLHGWLDNCASNHPLAEHLTKIPRPLRVTSIDFVGHGMSR